jgi:hypothetical protein
MMFKGPLGIWPFPILNLLLTLLSRSNVEVWQWEDCEGNLRRIVVYRQVEPGWLKSYGGANSGSLRNMAFPNLEHTPYNIREAPHHTRSNPENYTATES